MCVIEQKKCGNFFFLSQFKFLYDKKYLSDKMCNAVCIKQMVFGDAHLKNSIAHVRSLARFFKFRFRIVNVDNF